MDKFVTRKTHDEAAVDTLVAHLKATVPQVKQERGRSSLVCEKRAIFFLAAPSLVYAVAGGLDFEISEVSKFSPLQVFPDQLILRPTFPPACNKRPGMNLRTYKQPSAPPSLLSNAGVGTQGAGGTQCFLCSIWRLYAPLQLLWYGIAAVVAPVALRFWWCPLHPAAFAWRPVGELLAPLWFLLCHANSCAPRMSRPTLAELAA